MKTLTIRDALVARDLIKPDPMNANHAVKHHHADAKISQQVAIASRRHEMGMKPAVAVVSSERRIGYNVDGTVRKY